MLFVDTEESLTASKDKPYAAMLAKIMSGVVSRIKQASVFVLDPMASVMCANVFFSRPSSILAALDHVRLPMPTVWIEYSNLAAREAFARMGNENTWIDGAVFIEKTGMVLTQRGSFIDMEAVAQFKKDDGTRIIELLTTKCTFDATPGRFILGGVEPRPVSHAATGQAKRYYDMLSRDEKEAAANKEIRERFVSRPHPDYAEVSSLMPRASVEKAMEGHAEDMFRMFTTQILPSLILMNCRNAVEQEDVPAPAKLNKARRAKGRVEIGPYRVIKLKLRDKVRKRHEARGRSGVSVAGGLVIGHFKARSSGVFWWSPHVRGEIPSSAPRTVHVVTP